MTSNEVKGDRFLNFFITVIVDLPGRLGIERLMGWSGWVRVGQGMLDAYWVGQGI